MDINKRKIFRYVYISVFVLWILISVPVLYWYIKSYSTKKPSKGGTFVEGVYHNINYMPYLSLSSEDKFYQSFLFKACYSPYVEGTKIKYQEDLCEINTIDNKIFHIKVKEGKKWSDGTDISIDDVFFTYKNIIKENSLGIKSLEVYGNAIKISIEKIDNDKIKVKFAEPSIDNITFFSNFILPEHVLKDQKIDFYKNEYSQNPVKSNCANLQKNLKDKNSIIFDLGQCDDSYIKNYQVKKFNDFLAMENYVNTTQDNIIDIYIGEEELFGYNESKVILNKYFGIFYNTKSDKLNNSFRKGISDIILNYIYTGDYENYLIKDHFLFNNLKDETFDTKKYLDEKYKIEQENLINNNEEEKGESKKPEKTKPSLEKTIKRTETKTIEKDIKGISKIISISGNSNYEFFEEKIEGILSLNFKIDNNIEYESISVSYNNGNLYTLKSYNQQNKTAKYNMATKYNNIKNGENNYTIYGIIGGKRNELGNIKLYIGEKPTETITVEIEETIQTENTTGTENIEILSGTQNTSYNTGENTDTITNTGNNLVTNHVFNIIYYADETSIFVVERIKDIFTEKGINQYFNYRKYQSQEEFEGKLDSKDYEIAIRGINLGLNQNISNIFLTDIPSINPSIYSNENLANNINQFFILYEKGGPTTTTNKIHEEINKIYDKNTPMIILGKTYGKIYIKENINFDIPKRLYDYSIRKNYINDIVLFYTPEVKQEEIFNIKNFVNFLKNKYHNKENLSLSNIGIKNN